MIGTLKFNLPEEKEEFEMALNVGKYHSAIHEMSEYLRRKLKYEQLSDQEHVVFTEVRKKFGEIIQQEGIEL